MSLLKVIERIEQVAMEQPAVNSVVPNDVFRLNTLQDAKYGVFAWTQGNHTAQVDSDTITYSFTLFYVDRLTPDQSNELEVQSVGMSVLHNVLQKLSLEMGVNQGTYTTFNQRFTDECAGVFCSVQLVVPVDDTCEDDY